MPLFIALLFPFFLFGQEIKLQVLGSGGPELDKRASASYLIWIDNKAKILIDFGGGAFARLGESGAKLEDIDTILFTHFHIDHVADFAALVKSSYFVNAKKRIDLIGPDGNRYFPNTRTFLNKEFTGKGVYSYMSEALDTESDYLSFYPYVYASDTNTKIRTLNKEGYTISLVGVDHGNVPALAYRIDIDGTSIVFSGDTSASTENLTRLSHDADILVAHHAITQDAVKAARTLHMTPLRIGEVAAKAEVKSLLLGHRMQRTYGHEKQSLQLIRKNFDAPVTFAEDLLIISLTKK